jgi:hypothetical protein
MVIYPAHYGGADEPGDHSVGLDFGAVGARSALGISDRLSSAPGWKATSAGDKSSTATGRQRGPDRGGRAQIEFLDAAATSARWK